MRSLADSTGNARCRVESSGQIALGKIGERDQFDSISRDRCAHPRAGQNLDLELCLGGGRNSADVSSRMKIQFRGAVADSIEHADYVVFAQMPALVQSVQRIGRGE